MPQVGERKQPNMGRFSKDPMYEYASQFFQTQQNMLRESHVDYSYAPVEALRLQGNRDALEKFFVENSSITPRQQMTNEQYEDHIRDMKELFINDVQAIQENTITGNAAFNPMVGLSLPMHKYLMLNCVFAQAMPRYVAKAPTWTETMETRWMITPDGKKIDIANQQNMIYQAWKNVNKPIEVPIVLPELQTTDILNEYFHVNRTSNNLDVSTHISAVAIEEWAKAGDTVLTINDGVITESTATEDGLALVWEPWEARFTSGYGEYNRVITAPVDKIISKNGTTTETFHDSLFASQQDNMFEINSGGKIKAVKMYAKFDPSMRNLRTPRVEWSERTSYFQIGNKDGITIPMTPELVKDVGAMYGINQVTKYMSMIKLILENVKDDEAHEFLNESFCRLDDEHKLARTWDMAPPDRYFDTHLEWLQKTAISFIDDYVQGLLTVLRDPNMEISIIGRPGIMKKLVPLEVSYTTPDNLGPIEMDFKKTVYTSDKKTYNFISSDKLMMNDELIILLNPKNTDRIVYRLVDYQNYISNEIRDSENPQLPSITAFSRYCFIEYQPVQGRLYAANVTGVRDYLPTNPDAGQQLDYAANDLDSVFKSYNPVTGKNEKPKMFGE